MPCGAVPSYIPTLAKFEKQRELPVVRSQHWHRPPAREECPNGSTRCSALSLCIPTWTAAVQEPTPFLPLLCYLSLHPALGEGARPVFGNDGSCVLNFTSRLWYNIVISYLICHWDCLNFRIIRHDTKAHAALKKFKSGWTRQNSIPLFFSKMAINVRIKVKNKLCRTGQLWTISPLIWCCLLTWWWFLSVQISRSRCCQHANTSNAAWASSDYN